MVFIFLINVIVKFKKIKVFFSLFFSVDIYKLFDFIFVRKIYQKVCLNQIYTQNI